jgi:DNA-binding NtrC family response regulator
MDELTETVNQSAKNILIVEDEKALLFGLKKLLQAPDINISTAQTLQEAITLINQQSFQAVITDLRLTGSALIEGMQVIKHVKTNQPDCKVIAITAYAEEGTKNEVEKLGVDYYLEKPVAPKTLKEILTSIGIKTQAA